MIAAEFKLRYSDIGPPRGPRAEALKWWADELKTRSNGRIEIEFFWGQSLIKAKDNLRALGSGLVETAQLIASYNAAELGLWNYASVPFGINDEWVGMRTWFEMLTTTPEAPGGGQAQQVQASGQQHDRLAAAFDIARPVR